MPLIRNSWGIELVSGRVGQSSGTFTQNGGQPLLRAQNLVSNPRTPAQETARANFSTFSKRWSGELDDSQRLAWETYAAANLARNRFGNLVRRNGISAYMECAVIAFALSGSASAADDAPTTSSPAPVTSYIDTPNIVFEDPGYSINVTFDTGNTTVAGLSAYMKITPAVALPGQTPQIKNLRDIFGPTADSFGTLTTNPVALAYTTLEDSLPFNLQLGGKVGISIEIVNAKGQSSGGLFNIFQLAPPPP